MNCRRNASSRCCSSRSAVGLPSADRSVAVRMSASRRSRDHDAVEMLPQRDRPRYRSRRFHASGEARSSGSRRAAAAPSDAPGARVCARIAVERLSHTCIPATLDANVGLRPARSPSASPAAARSGAAPCRSLQPGGLRDREPERDPVGRVLGGGDDLLRLSLHELGERADHALLELRGQRRRHVRGQSLERGAQRVAWRQSGLHHLMRAGRSPRRIGAETPSDILQETRRRARRDAIAAAAARPAAAP